MKRVVKTLVIALIMGMMIYSLSLVVNASEIITPVEGQNLTTPVESEIPTINSENQATEITPIVGENENTSTNTNQETNVVGAEKTETTDVAKDKAYPNAGIEVSTMVYIIAALLLFAIFAYFKVVKYNID